MLSLPADFIFLGADVRWRTGLDHLMKHKTLSCLCLMAVIASRVDASSPPVEAFKQGNCCAAQVFNYNKINDFSVAAQFCILILAVMSTYPTPPDDAAFNLASSGALCGVS